MAIEHCPVLWYLQYCNDVKLIRKKPSVIRGRVIQYNNWKK